MTTFDAAHAGQWHCIEAHARLNDAGRADGVFELWIDDRLEAHRERLNWVGDYTAYGFNIKGLQQAYEQE